MSYIRIREKAKDWMRAQWRSKMGNGHWEGLELGKNKLNSYAYAQYFERESKLQLRIEKLNPATLEYLLFFYWKEMKLVSTTDANIKQFPQLVIIAKRT